MNAGGIAVALCGLQPRAAAVVSTWLAGHPALGMTVAATADSPASLVEQLTTRPVHAAILDAALGLEGLSLAQELRAAGYQAVLVCGAANGTHFEQRAAARGVTTCPGHDPGALAALIRQLLGLAPGSPGGGRIIACHSPRGGAGTSTLALSMAALLATLGTQVALIEVSGGASAVAMLDLPAGGGWGEAASLLSTDLLGQPDAAATLAPAMRSVALDTGVEFALLASGGPLVMDQIGPDEVETLLSVLPTCGYDSIIVDTAAELTVPTASALAVAHTLCLITTPDEVGACRLVQTQEVLTGLAVPPERVVPVINRMKDRLPPRLQEVLRFLGYRPAHRIPEDGRPPTDPSGRFTGFRPGSAAARAIEDLVKQLNPHGAGRVAP